ncbi:MAG: hypothetical protein A2W31_15715 [Planctomycetes bacterium RBG_16_64_10]|nr:MAG: hypothetical protein A2W31_15715 [Planctomycetes bacterium RBG_16_64_10]
MGSRFQGDGARFDAQDVVTGLLILAVVVLAVIGSSQLLSRQDRQRVRNNPRELFRSLCRAHALDRSSRRLLWELARWQRLAQPACLFLEPNRFDAANLSPPLRQRHAEVKALCAKIFPIADCTLPATDHR